MAEIYKLSKRDGVLGYRPTGREVSINSYIVAERIGLALDATELWEVKFRGGRTLVVNGEFGADGGYRKAVRVNDPELGRIWYVDLTQSVDVRVPNLGARLFEEGVGTVYIGEGGSIGEAFNGQRWTFEDGTSFVTYIVPA